MTLDELIIKNEWPFTAWVDEPGFDNLYVRITKRYLEDQSLDTIDLANINAINPGQGAFTNLVARLMEQYPRYAIYVESVVNPRFDVRLLKMGFVEHKHNPHSYYILPKE